MRILTRYILREFLIPFFYCLVGFLSIYVLFELFGSFSRMMEAKLSFMTMAKYFFAYLAPYFHYILPAALMLATIYTMWNFCRHSEIIAMRANGIGFMTIVKPLLLVACFSMVAVYWVNESFVPSYAHWAAQMKTVKFNEERLKSADNIVYRNAAENRTWNIDQMLDHDAQQLKNVTISIDSRMGTRQRTIRAERADFLDGEWWLTNAKVQHYDSLGREVATPMPEIDVLPLRCFAEFSETPSDFIMQNRPWKYNSTRDRLRYLEMHPELAIEMRRDYQYDLWCQLMAPLACLIITLFSIPAGISSGRQNVFKGILGALGLYFAFYALEIGLMVITKNGWLNPIIGATLPCVVFMIIGIRSFVKLH